METSILIDIGIVKQRIMTKLLNSKEICEVLLRKDNPTNIECEQLKDNQIFNFLYVSEEQTDTKSYICFDIDPYFATSTIKDLKIEFWIYSHKDIMNCSKEGYLGTTADILTDMVDRLLKDSDDFGIGKLKFKDANHFFPNIKYYGRKLEYIIPDFKEKEWS